MQSIGTLASGIAHNFNNILGSVLGFIEMALMDIPPDSDAGSDLKKAVKGIDDAKELSDRMLIVGRKREHKFKRLEIHTILREAVELFKASVGVVEIREDIDVNCGFVMADANEIKQAVVNLCKNAHHALSDDNGLIEVSLEQMTIDSASARTHSQLQEGRYAHIAVSDTGHGMDRKAMGRIFEPFFTTKEVGKGTGLGLSMVHGTVMSHGGEITVNSEPGKGAAFNVYLPLIDDDTNRREG